MKKIILGLLVSAAFISCKKDTQDWVSNSKISNNDVTINPTTNPTTDNKPANPFNANFVYKVQDPNNIFENQLIRLRPLGSGIVSYLWNIDNVKYYTRDVDISFMIHGYKNVTLTVTDAQGNTASSMQDISILCNFGGGGNH